MARGGVQRIEISLEAARFLVSAEGVRAADELDRLPGSKPPGLRELENLRGQWGAAFAAALLDQSLGRRTLSAKHPLASRLFTTKLAAEQASGADVARWRARRFAGADRVFDVGTGCGFDAIALAGVAPVVLIDRAHARLVLARENLLKTGAGTAVPIVAEWPLALARDVFLFADPDRRVAGQKTTSPEEGSPPLSSIVGHPSVRGAGVKLSPMAELADVAAFGELEFISHHGELKEICLWTGSLKGAERRVSMPSAGRTFTGDPGIRPAVRDVGTILLDPDPALVRSGLLGALAAAADLGGIAPDIAYLTADRDPREPFLDAFLVREVLGPKPRGAADFLRAAGGYAETVRRRGFAVSPEEMQKALPKAGPRAFHLFLTRVGTEPRIIVAEKLR